MEYKKWKQEATDAMAVAREPKRVILLYAGVTLALSLLTSLISVWTNHNMSGAGGLSNLGTRSMLTTVQTVAPLAVSLILMCWDLGYLSAALRFSRKQYADGRDLSSGFRMFGPLLRMKLLQIVLYLGALLISTWVGSQIFTLTPFANDLMQTMEELIGEGLTTTEALLASDRFLQAMTDATVPILCIVGILFLALMLPIFYRYRMASYRLLEHPREGAMAALRNSRTMMRGHCMSLLKLDLSFWWFYLLNFLATLVCYGDQILTLLGISLPVSSTVGYFLFYGLYLVLQFGILYCFRNYMEVCYARAYETIRPAEQENSVVLGNIFQM